MGIEGIKRPDGWDRRLRALIESARSQPFEWGRLDCCTFALADYEAMTGRGAPNVEPWSSLLQAKRLLKRKTIRAWATDWFGAPGDMWQAGQRGDIALIDATRDTLAESSDALGVIVGATICCPGEEGLEFVPLSSARAVWRI